VTGAAGAGLRRTGRPPATTPERLAEIALDLFVANGFDETTVDDVAAAAGIARRTFFAYYPSKNDLVWGDFDAHLARLRAELDRLDDRPMMQALREAVVKFNHVDPGYLDRHRNRMRLILTVAALQAHATLRHAAWRRVIQEFAAARTGIAADAFLPRLLGHVALAASTAAYEQWLADPATDLSDLIDAAFVELPRGFTHHEHR
jgi:TetR/AcrR family transcriptional regulator, regulator of mycofactocin system